MTRIGVLGAGQLGRMLALAGYPLNLEFRFLDDAAHASAGQVAPLRVASWEDETVLREFAQGVDLITYEFENLPVKTLKFLSTLKPVYPSLKALEVSQDRLLEKRFFQSLKIPTPRFWPIESLEDLKQALRESGTPAVLKTRRLGYDGKGQVLIQKNTKLESIWEEYKNQSLILEEFVPFEGEVSLISVRGKKGETRFYPVVQNYHHEGILRLSLAPNAALIRRFQKKAEAYAKKVLQTLDYVGVLTIEFFYKNGKLLVNEMAPRVHNSGHWTIEGAECSQFENHLRAGLGLPLGSTKTIAASAMLNLIGEIPDLKKVLSFAGASLHLYGKAPKPKRKLGHITFQQETFSTLQKKLPLLPLTLPLSPKGRGWGRGGA